MNTLLNMLQAYWALLHSPVIWVPGLLFLMVWVTQVYLRWCTRTERP